MEFDDDPDCDLHSQDHQYDYSLQLQIMSRPHQLNQYQDLQLSPLLHVQPYQSGSHLIQIRREGPALITSFMVGMMANEVYNHAFFNKLKWLVLSQPCNFSSEQLGYAQNDIDELDEEVRQTLMCKLLCILIESKLEDIIPTLQRYTIIVSLLTWHISAIIKTDEVLEVAEQLAKLFRVPYSQAGEILIFGSQEKGVHCKMAGNKIYLIQKELEKVSEQGQKKDNSIVQQQKDNPNQAAVEDNANTTPILKEQVGAQAAPQTDKQIADPEYKAVMPEYKVETNRNPVPSQQHKATPVSKTKKLPSHQLSTMDKMPGKIKYSFNKYSSNNHYKLTEKLDNRYGYDKKIDTTYLLDAYRYLPDYPSCSKSKYNFLYKQIIQARKPRKCHYISPPQFHMNYFPYTVFKNTSNSYYYRNQLHKKCHLSSLKSPYFHHQTNYSKMPLILQSYLPPKPPTYHASPYRKPIIPHTNIKSTALQNYQAAQRNERFLRLTTEIYSHFDGRRRKRLLI